MNYGRNKWIDTFVHQYYGNFFLYINDLSDHSLHRTLFHIYFHDQIFCDHAHIRQKNSPSHVYHRQRKFSAVYFFDTLQ